MDKRKIAHAIAYIDVFMMNQNSDDSDLKDIFKYADSLSSQDIISIIKYNVKRNKITGYDVVLKEMDTEDFAVYIESRIYSQRDHSMEA